MSIRLKFTRTNLMRTQQKLLDVLKEKFDIQLVESDPDYVIACAFDTFEVMEYPKAVKILFTGENNCPDFNFYDYAIGFDHLSFGDRYLRLPLYCFYPDFDKLCETTTGKDALSRDLAQRKFCSFVVSNGKGSDPIRTNFFEELCKYKKVDSAGRYLNNMGGGYLEDKRSFIAGYKFNIAFENSMVDGYTTEKIMEPMTVNSVPIYWGNRFVGKDFNPQSFVSLSSASDISECIDIIIAMDKDDDLYMEMLQQPWFNEDGGYRDYKERLWSFFGKIFEKPLTDARYISDFGYQKVYRDKLQQYNWMAPYWKPLWYYHRGKQKLFDLFTHKK